MSENVMTSFGFVQEHIKNNGFVTRSAWAREAFVFLGFDGMRIVHSTGRSNKYVVQEDDLFADDWYTIPIFLKNKDDEMIPFHSGYGPNSGNIAYEKLIDMKSASKQIGKEDRNKLALVGKMIMNKVCDDELYEKIGNSVIPWLTNYKPDPPDQIVVSISVNVSHVSKETEKFIAV